jgi:glutathione synthase/RimK-type ligase-like ATP-grasp enzyme
MPHELVVLYEHPEWQKPLWAALDRRGVRYAPLDLKRAAFDPESLPEAPLYFNQASPSAYVRGNARAVPLALSLMRSLEAGGARVLNGSRAFLLEIAKSAQAALLAGLGIEHPRSLAFNDVEAALERWTAGWPALLKPEQGGSGARMFLLQSPDELRRLLRDQPRLWQPDNLLLLQEYFPIDPARGIVRMEFLGGSLLYAMRVVSHGAFNLCPSEACHPEGGGDASHCDAPAAPPGKPVEFYPYPEVPPEAVRAGERIVKAGGLDVGGIEYLEAADGRRVFYDINANSNLRAPIGRAFGFDPFERVVDYLTGEMAGARLFAFARRYTSAWCSGDPARVASFFSPDASLAINDGAPAVGRRAIEEVARGFMTAFPGMVVAMDEVVERDGGGVYHWTLTGANTGPGGTGRRVRLSGREEWRLGADGLIAESKGHFDAADYERQLRGA